MNRLEELLIILSEECAEVQQAATKCIRFGMASTHNGQIPESNQLRLEKEIGDFMAMVRLLTEEYNLNMDNIIEAADAKLIKVEKFMRNPKGMTTAQMVDHFAKNPLPPISIEKPHRRGPRKKTR